MTSDDYWDHSYTWRIENYSQSSYESNVKLTSPEFEVKTLSNRTWCIWFYPEGLTANEEGFVSCFLCQLTENESDKECVIDLEFTFMNANSSILKSAKFKNCVFGRDKNQLGIPQFFEVDQLKVELKKCSEDSLIVQCRIKNKEASNKMKSEKYCLKWPVQILPNGVFTSAKHFFCLDNLLLQMILYLKDGDYFIEICNLTKCVLPSNPITCKISVLNAKGNETLSKTDTHTFDITKESETWEFPCLMTVRKLQDKMSEYVIDGNIVFRCEFSLRFEGLVAANVSNPNSETVSNIEGIVSLISDLQSLFCNPSHSDVKLRVNGEIELDAHRSLLVTRSAVFSAMFNGETLENRTGIVDIEDVDSNILKSFLEFLYTGTVKDMNNEKAVKLLIVADKYQVSSLKEMCATFLISTISVNKVCTMLALADMVNHEHLKNTCIGYISTHVMDIFSLEDWIVLIKNNADLAAEVTTYISKNCTVTPHCS